jgi:hypothetical protein
VHPRRTAGAPGRALALALIAVVLAGCGRFGGEDAAAGGLAIGFEDVEAPDAFAFSGTARVAPEDSAGGVWATVPGLPRAERALVRRAGAEDGVEVALFRAGGGIRLSVAAGSELGLAPGDEAAVEVVALRREPRILEP